MEATYFKLWNVSDRMWRWTTFLRASGASEQRSQFPSYTYTFYCLAYISCCNLILSDISDTTLHFTMCYWNSAIYVKLFTNCKLLSVGNSIKTSGSSGWCDYFTVPMCQSVGLWLTFTRPSLAVLTRKLLPNLKPIPFAFVIRYGGDLFQTWERVGSVVKLD